MVLILDEDHNRFLRLFGDYLQDCKLSPTSIAIYTRIIKGFFERGFSIADLEGSVDEQIEQYSKGGQNYHAKDHGNTVAALKKARDFFRKDINKHFSIAYHGSYQSFFPKGKYAYSYDITNGLVNITYGNGPLPGKTVSKKLSNKYEDAIFHLLYRYRYLLSKETKPINTFHGPLPHYSYEFLNKKCDSCGAVFSSDGGYSVQDVAQANDKLRAIIDRIIK